MTLADRLREEGRLEGEQRGRAEGEQRGRAEGEQRGRAEGEQRGAIEGQRKVLLKQLTLRFGKLPEAASNCVNGADAAQLEAWAERVLTAPTLADVLDAR